MPYSLASCSQWYQEVNAIHLVPVIPTFPVSIKGKSRLVFLLALPPFLVKGEQCGDHWTENPDGALDCISCSSRNSQGVRSLTS